MATAKNTAHVSEALDRLPHIHRDKPKTASFLTAFINSVQDLEDTLWQLYAERNIDTAIGAQLDLIGKIVGQPRNGVTDDDLYRRYVRARISTNKSKATIEDVITVGELVVDDSTVSFVWDNIGAAAGELKLQDAIVPGNVSDILIEFLRDTVAGGVKIILISQAALDSDTFRLSPYAQITTLPLLIGQSVALAIGMPATEFPADGGTLVFEAGVANEEVIAYDSHDGAKFFLSTTATKNHLVGSAITLDEGTDGKGYSDDVATSQGGQLVSAKD